MKSLTEVLNAQTDSYIERLSANPHNYKVRTYYLDNKCVWRNSDLHILFSERLISLPNEAIKDDIEDCINRQLYTILRIDRLLHHHLHTVEDLADFLNKKSPPNTDTELTLSADFNYDAVLKAARYRAAYRSYYVNRYCPLDKEVHRIGSKQHQRPVEEISVEKHRKYYESKNMTVEGVAYYLEIPVSRARALSHCPGFPISESGWPKRVPVSALNSWLLENPELYEIPTGSLLKYLNEKVSRL